MTIGVFFIIVIMTILSGCAAKKSLWGDPKSGLILTYRMGENQKLKYEQTAEILQNLEMMGQVMEVEVNKMMRFSMESKGEEGMKLRLGVTIDTMAMEVFSPQADITVDMSPVMGKSFDMILSSLGQELDLSGAESIQYDLPSEGKRDVVSDFKTFFPNLAGRPLKIGDTWTSQDTLIQKANRGALNIIFNSVNEITGFETLNGLECVKIVSKFTGTLDGQGEQQGMDLNTEGDTEGTDTWYFAYKKGIFVQLVSEGMSEGTITVSGPQNMSIPMTMETKFTTKLIQ